MPHVNVLVMVNTIQQKPGRGLVVELKFPLDPLKLQHRLSEKLAEPKMTERQLANLISITVMPEMLIARKSSSPCWSVGLSTAGAFHCKGPGSWAGLAKSHHLAASVEY